MSVTTPAGKVRELWPLLGVKDMERSIAFYRDLLGFQVVREATDAGKIFWCRLVRDGCSLMLQQVNAKEAAEARGRSVIFYFVCDDANAIHAELASRGLQLDPPTDAYYGMRQLELKDPDGYSLCFESEIAQPQ